jgi:hypothetical protein
MPAESLFCFALAKIHVASDGTLLSFASSMPCDVCVSIEHDVVGPRRCYRPGAVTAQAIAEVTITKSRIAFSTTDQLIIWSVFSPSDRFAPTSIALIGSSILLLAIAALFGALNLSKAKNLQATAANAVIARETVEQSHAKKETDLKVREAAIAEAQAKLAERDEKMVASDEHVAQILDENKQLEAKLQDKESEVAILQKQIAEKQPASANPGAPTIIELQAQLDDARQQLDSAEQEKSLLSEKMQPVKEKSSQLEDEKKRRAIARGKVGVRGTILAVNQAYNFVVLNLGGRNGVEAHSEMRIVRDGTYIGKIRISPVEPATAIGDIITNTLGRGVQVQPGDIVIYAGSDS